MNKLKFFVPSKDRKWFYETAKKLNIEIKKAGEIKYAPVTPEAYDGKKLPTNYDEFPY